MKQNKLIDKLFLIIVTIQTILMGILFIIQILRIYYGNEGVFSKEICSKYILQILPVIILWIILIIASYIRFYITDKKDNNIAKLTNISKLKTLESMCDLNENNELQNEYKLLKDLKFKRKLFYSICIVILIVCSFMGLSYLFNVKHFDISVDITSQIVKMTVHLMPWVIITFVSFIIFSFYEEFNAKKQIELIKYIIKTNGKKEEIGYQVNKKKQLIIKISRICIILVAAILIIVGIIDGQAESVLQKAVNICTECIGLG